MCKIIYTKKREEIIVDDEDYDELAIKYYGEFDLTNKMMGLY